MDPRGIGPGRIVGLGPVGQLGWTVKTNLPVGLTTVGLGNGLVSMEIGGLVGLKISEDCYLQGNFTEWIPFGGLAPFYPGAMVITRLSLNQKIWQANPKVPVFLNLEYSGYFFQAAAAGCGFGFGKGCWPGGCVQGFSSQERGLGAAPLS